MNPFCRKDCSNFNRHTADVFEDLGIVNKEGVQEFYAGRFKLENAQYTNAEWFAKAIRKQYFISDVFLGLRSSPHFIISVKHTTKIRISC